MNVPPLLAAVLLCLLSSLASATVSSAELNQRYANKVLTFRHFYRGDSLIFRSDGSPVLHHTIGSWTVDGQLRIREISLKNGELKIRASRVYLVYDKDSKQMRDVSTLTPEQAREHNLNNPKLQEWLDKSTKTEIRLDCGVKKPEMADVERAMQAVFLLPDEELSDVAPDYWEPWLLRDKPARPRTPHGSNPQTTYPVGGGVSAPRALYTPDPSYSDAAREARYQASALLWLVVGTDGLPAEIRIQRPAGMGLDEQAIGVVQNWRFEPAKKDGEPVPVQIWVEVSFKLF